MTTDIALMKAMSAKMGYLNQRQKVISQNIANADTPNYQPSDLSKLNFDGVLKKVTGSNAVTMETTNPMHMPAPNQVANAKIREQKLTYEVAPDKNGVVLEEQLIKSNEVQMDYALMVNLYKQNNDMMRTALGRR